jgi:hypothetical protein
MSDEISLTTLSDIPTVRLDELPMTILDDIQDSMDPNASVNRVVILDEIRRNVEFR